MTDDHYLSILRPTSNWCTLEIDKADFLVKRICGEAYLGAAASRLRTPGYTIRTDSLDFLIGCHCVKDQPVDVGAASSF